jgi:hypothetical protein
MRRSNLSHGSKSQPFWDTVILCEDWHGTLKAIMSFQPGKCIPLTIQPLQIRLIATRSLDRTTRIHGPWKREMDTLGAVETWHEISRPQIHGYDLIAATFLGPTRFVSVADEKVARVFDAPKGFIKTLKGVGITDGDAGEIVSALSPPSVNTQDEESTLRMCGLLPRSCRHSVSQTRRQVTVSYFSVLRNVEYGKCSSSIYPTVIVIEDDAEMHQRPPLEPELGALTLWPESEKLFGHGYEVRGILNSQIRRMRLSIAPNGGIFP